MKLVIFFYMFMTSLCAALIMVPSLTDWAHAKGAVDLPGDERKIHHKAIPRIGGVAIFMAFFIAMLIFVDFSLEVRGILLGTSIIFLTGLMDDLQGVSPRNKLVGQIGAATITILTGKFYITHLGNLLGIGDIILPIWLALPFTVLALVGVTNAINLIDGLDGLAGGVAVVALLAFFCLAYLHDNFIVMTISACLLGAIAGFLKFNIYPARIFMGDAGSLSIGFLLATMSILLTQGRGGVSPVAPFVILGLPIIDTLWVMTRRISHFQSPFAADRGHFHHKFLDLGVQHRFTVIIIYLISIISAVVAIGVHDLNESILFFSYLIVFLLIFFLLRLCIRNRDKYKFFKFDSSTDIRSTVIYSNFVKYVDKYDFIISILLVLYLFFCMISLTYRHEFSLIIPISILSVGFFVKNYIKIDNNNLNGIIFYFSFIFLSYYLEVSGKQKIYLKFCNCTQDDIVNSIFILLILLLSIRIAISSRGGIDLNGIDLLLLGATVILIPIFPLTSGDAFSLGTLMKGVILYCSLRVMSVHSVVQSRFLEKFLQTVLIVVVLAKLTSLLVNF